MQIVPLKPVPSQDTYVTLADQICRISVYQKRYGLFIDLYVDDAIIIGGVICLNQTLVVRETYRGFVGDLTFVDNQGSSDPDYTGLGNRFSLAYLDAAELAVILPGLSP